MEKWVISSVGRALRLHRRCREFESLITHHRTIVTTVKPNKTWVSISQCTRAMLPTNGMRPNALNSSEWLRVLGLRFYITKHINNMTVDFAPQNVFHHLAHGDLPPIET